MAQRLRVGVIGLGRRWLRYQPALLSLRQQVEVVAVCDPHPGRTEQAARSVGCTTADGDACFERGVMVMQEAKSNGKTTRARRAVRALALSIQSGDIN